MYIHILQGELLNPKTAVKWNNEWFLVTKCRIQLFFESHGKGGLSTATRSTKPNFMVQIQRSRYVAVQQSTTAKISHTKA